MLAAFPVLDSEHLRVVSAERGKRPTAPAAFAESGLERLLAPGEALMRAGDRKTHIYRVTSGILSATHEGPSQNVVGQAGPGDIIGLGSLERHVLTMTAVGAAAVQCLPRNALPELLLDNAHLAHRHAVATEAELSVLRERLQEEGRADALVRVGSLLCVLASTNGHEGRNSAIVSDDISCGFITQQLGLDIAALQRTLVTLSDMGLIAPLPGGALQILNRRGLEQLCEHPDPFTVTLQGR